MKLAESCEMKFEELREEPIPMVYLASLQDPGQVGRQS